MKKLFASAVAAALALSMAVPAFAADSSLNVTASVERAKAGEEFSVSMSLTGLGAMLGENDYLGGASFMLNFDPDVLELPYGMRNNPDGTQYRALVLAGADSGFMLANAIDCTDEQIGGEPGTISIALGSAIGVESDPCSLGSLNFKVKENVDASVESTKIFITASAGDKTFTTIGGEFISADAVTLGEATVAIGEEPVSTEEPTTDEPTTDEPTTDEPTTDEPTTDEPTTDAGDTTGGSTGDTTDGDKTSGGSTGGSGTTGGSGDNNKTGDAGVLAIGGLMVLAAGATMLTLKKKSK